MSRSSAQSPQLVRWRAQHTIDVWSRVEDIVVGRPIDMLVVLDDGTGMFHFDPACVRSCRPTRVWLRRLALPEQVCPLCVRARPADPNRWYAQWCAWAFAVGELLTHQQAWGPRVFADELWAAYSCAPDSQPHTRALLRAGLDVVEFPAPTTPLHLVVFAATQALLQYHCPEVASPGDGRVTHLTDRGFHTSEAVRGFAAGMLFPVAEPGTTGLYGARTFVAAVPESAVADVERLAAGPVRHFGEVGALTATRVLIEHAAQDGPGNFEELLSAAAVI